MELPGGLCVLEAHLPRGLDIFPQLVESLGQTPHLLHGRFRLGARQDGAVPEVPLACVWPEGQTQEAGLQKATEGGGQAVGVKS